MSKIINCPKCGKIRNSKKEFVALTYDAEGGITGSAHRCTLYEPNHFYFISVGGQAFLTYKQMRGQTHA